MPVFPQTKFCPPLSHRDVIPRANLTRWLQQAVPASRLVLLTAPAGYGKTTLLSTLPQALPEYRLAWLALDPEDNDLVRFLGGLGEALARIDPTLKQTTESQIAASVGLVSGSGVVVPLRQTMIALVNAVVDLPGDPFVLVLDDLHEITNPAIYEALGTLIETLPGSMHLAISTRREPALHLNRLRARRQVAELDMARLRFDLEECQRFLNGLFHLELSETDLRFLQEKTEGWPVGLVLLTGRLRDLPPPQERAVFLRSLDPVDPTTFNYLADEVLLRQPDTLRNFLLETSVLAELTPSACREVTGREDSAVLLVDAYRRNLFLAQTGAPAPDAEPVYRYHALFAGFLQHELQRSDPERARLLHVRAAKAESDPGRVIAHLLAARAWAEAAATIETSGEQFLQQGLQETVRGWIQSLPAGLAQAHPRLMYLRGFCDLLEGDLPEARLSLERCLQAPDPVSDPQTRGQALVALASQAFIRAEFTRCAELLAQVEPGRAGAQERLVFLMLRASLSLFWKSDWSQAAQDLKAAVAFVMGSEDTRLWFLFSLYLAPEFTVLPGALDLLEQFCKDARLRYQDRVTPLRLGVEDTWANIHLRRGRLAQAIAVGRDALSVKEQLGGYGFLGLNAALAMAAAWTGQGNYPAADETLQRVAAQVREAELHQALTGGGLYPLAKLRWLQGQTEEARRLYRQMSALELRLPLVDVLQPMLAGLLEMDAKRYPQAEASLAEAVRLQTREWVSEIYGSARLLLACLYLRWEKPQAALQQLDAVLTRCEQRQTPGIVLQDMPLAAPLLRLAVKRGTRARQAAALLEEAGLPLEENREADALLTARQLEVLRLMAAGYSNQAIADTLDLRLATVKSHVAHLMDRLGASSRMETVARAREKGLLK